MSIRARLRRDAWIGAIGCAFIFTTLANLSVKAEISFSSFEECMVEKRRLREEAQKLSAEASELLYRALTGPGFNLNIPPQVRELDRRAQQLRDRHDKIKCFKGDAPREATHRPERLREFDHAVNRLRRAGMRPYPVAVRQIVGEQIRRIQEHNRDVMAKLDDVARVIAADQIAATRANTAPDRTPAARPDPLAGLPCRTGRWGETVCGVLRGQRPGTLVFEGAGAECRNVGGKRVAFLSPGEYFQDRRAGFRTCQ